LKDNLSILQEFWGFSSFRSKQNEIITSVLENNDTIALLPTGGGKSLCYQLPGLKNEGICLVVSPLIALMLDQVDQLNKKGIKAIAITSGMSQKSIDIQLDNAIYGNTKFLYVSPERLKSRLFRARFEKMNVNLIAVDEAHCISEWGYDFRPSYLNIADIREIHPEVPIIALTATATKDVIEDIQDKLKFKEKNLIIDSFLRKNLTYKTFISNNKLNRIEEYLKKEKGSGIIYCSTRKNVKLICQTLIDKGIAADFYHGGLDFESRKTRQERWISNETQVIVCTNAFGMGIDKPDVKFVLHYDIPDSIEAYFQEAGRAGRNGEPAEATLFYEGSDIDLLKEKSELKFPPIETIKKIYNAVGNHFQLAIGSGHEETFPIDILEFCDKYNFNLITVYNGLKFLELSGFISLSDNHNRSSQLKILIDNKGLYNFQVQNDELNKIIQFILRTQMGVFDDYVHINENKISAYTKLPLTVVTKKLTHLDEQEAISYLPQQRGASITFSTERLSDNNMSIPPKFYHDRKKIAQSKLESMIGYLNSNECTNVYLLKYFGEENATNCGKCDKCTGVINNRQQLELHEVIEVYLDDYFKLNDHMEIIELISKFSSYSKEEIVDAIRRLVDHDIVLIDSLGKQISRN
jgi:ATP-dependent DNA helicase RecQ